MFLYFFSISYTNILTTPQKYNMKESDTAMSCMTLVCMTVLLLPLGITCVIVGSQSQPECSIEYSDIEFSYSEWMVIKGIVDLAILGFASITMISGIFVSWCKEWTPIMLLGVGIPYILFSFSWYIVGGVLLFSTMTDCTGEPLWTFGLVLFIWQSLGLIGGSVGSNRD